MKVIEELLEPKRSSSGLANRDQQPCGPAALITLHPLTEKVIVNSPTIFDRSVSIICLQTKGHELKMPSGTSYRVALVRTDVSENISSPFSGSFTVIGLTVALPW
jgi:hypothetical protein